MRVIFLALLVLATIGGCKTVTDFLIEQEAPEKIAKTIDAYCEEIPAQNREQTRDAINAASKAGNSIEITCAGDSP